MSPQEAQNSVEATEAVQQDGSTSRTESHLNVMHESAEAVGQEGSNSLGERHVNVIHESPKAVEQDGSNSSDESHVNVTQESSESAEQDGSSSRDESRVNVIHASPGAVEQDGSNSSDESHVDVIHESVEAVEEDGGNSSDERHVNEMHESSESVEEDAGNSSDESHVNVVHASPVAVRQDGSNSRDEIRVMHESGQTDEERHQIRKAQRLLFSKLVETGDDLNIDEVRGENNEIFCNVYYPREAILDGTNMNAIAGRAAQKVDRLFKVPRYDADRLISKLRSKCRNSDGHFDWLAFGSQAGTCFDAIPSNVSFFNGSLTNGRAIKVRQRAKRERVVEEDAEEEEPEEVREHTDRNADQLSAIQKSMRSMRKTLKTRVLNTYYKNKRKLQEMHEGGEIPPRLNKKLKKHGVEIDAIRFLFNPHSFTQTVENIFHYSFLVKEGLSTLRVRKKGFGDDFGAKTASGGLACQYVEDAKSHNSPNTQAVLSLTMQDWRDLCIAFDVKNGDLPYRIGSTQTKTVELSQESELSDDPS
mmetsp:Transcript_30354/g.72742  ORF Transcript_30354/g.72742 Transcript_30354/m.72742 type:complete len:532 (+) Transcript_30354:153-1748(+)|eukprot:CAMPEP_0113621604 /NCGR_PEP_ID=MMETSP0017_2-20120614/11047_1 /TAXON_ID=2856 /ORGANISM="Cylindrotheca closterium" /LENGTH=531 /DNA_ID=CAMNT_0000531367 /DNA_START=114 /DNA_END=1709 /DNA_ORIENTATION=+ /assembly_acc=CAM_ASM_000147